MNNRTAHSFGTLEEVGVPMLLSKIIREIFTFVGSSTNQDKRRTTYARSDTMEGRQPEQSGHLLLGIDDERPPFAVGDD